MHVIDQAEQTRRSLQEAIDKLSQAVEKTLELIARTQSEGHRHDPPLLSDAFLPIDELDALHSEGEPPADGSGDPS